MQVAKQREIVRDQPVVMVKKELASFTRARLLVLRWGYVSLGLALCGLILRFQQ